MYLNSIKGLDEIIKATDYYKTKRPTRKPKEIDGANFIINHIISVNRHKSLSNYIPANVYSQIFKRVLGNGYRKEVNRLINLDIINVNEDYLYYDNGQKGYCKQYSLTDKAKKLGITKTAVLTRQIEKKISTYSIDYIKRIRKNTIDKKISDNICKVKLDSELIKKEVAGTTKQKDKIQKQNKYSKSTFDFFQRTDGKKYDRLYDSYFFYFPTDFGRVYHCIGTIQREYRKQLKHIDGGKLAEIDGRTFQPMLLALMYADATGDNSVIKDFINQDWYKFVGDSFIKNGYIKLGSTFYTDRGKFKKDILANGFYSKEYYETFEALYSIYPEFMQWVFKYKQKHGYNSLPIDASTLESDIFIRGVFASTDKFAIPIHDSLIVKVEDVEYFTTLLVKLMQDKFNFVAPETFNNVFKIEYYD